MDARARGAQWFLSFARRYLIVLGGLEPRSLACFRIGAGCVLLYDLFQSWSLIPIWTGVQGYADGLPLPDWARLASDEQTLRVIFAGYGLAVCGYQYVSWQTVDYHDLVLVNLLLWAQALPLGERLSADAYLSAGQASKPPSARATRLTTAAGCGFALTLAFVYLDTARRKTGPAWWSDGTAVWLALTDFASSSQVGMWAADTFGFPVFRMAAHATVAVEWIALLLILSPWSSVAARTTGCLLLIGFHSFMWLTMDIGAFPPAMIFAAAALLAAPCWQWCRRLCDDDARHRSIRGGGTAAGHSQSSRWSRRALAALLFGCMVVNIEGSRLRLLPSDEAWPYPGADSVLRLKYFLGLETEWSMYAPEPPEFGGWWVAVGRTADGRELDPITGGAPTFARPWPRTGPFAGHLGLFWSQHPGPEDESWEASQHRYLRFLLWQDERSPHQRRLTDLWLIYMYEPLLPPERARSTYPLLVLKWPQESMKQASGSLLRREPVYEIDLQRLGDPDWVPATADLRFRD